MAGGVPRPGDRGAATRAAADGGPAEVTHRHGPATRPRELRGEGDRPAERPFDHGAVELRQPGRRHVRGDRGQLGVEPRPRARREACIAVARDRPQLDRLPRPVLRIAAGHPADGAERVDVRNVEPPREQRDERLPLRGGDAAGVVVADQGNADRPGVEPLGLRTDHVPVDPAGAPFEDLAVPVDEKVVADVVPVVPAHVVQLDPAHDRRRSGRAVRVRAGRVVDDRERDGPGIARRRALDRLVGAPLRARHDLRRPGHRDAPDRGVRDRGPDVPGAEAPHVPDEPERDPVGRADPVRVAEVPAGPHARFGARRIGKVLALRGRASPGAPAARLRASPEKNGGRSPASGTRPGRSAAAQPQQRVSARRRSAGPAR